MPSGAPAADSSLHPLAVDRAVRDQELPAEVADRPGAQPVFPGLALPRQRPRRQSRTASRGTSSRPRASRCGECCSGKDDWMSYCPIPRKRLAEIEQKYGSRLRTFTPPNLMYFFMNTPCAAVRQPQGAAGGELRDLAAMAHASRRRPRASDREHPAAAVSLLPGAQPLSAQPPQGEAARPRIPARVGLQREAGHRLEPRRRRRPAVHRVPRLGAETARLPREREGRDGRGLLDDARQREDEGADRLRRLGSGLPSSARLVRAPRRAHDHTDAQLELRELRRRLGESRHPGAHPAAEVDAGVDRGWAALERR